LICTSPLYAFIPLWCRHKVNFSYVFNPPPPEFEQWT
jgi:hypothetical protein